MILNFIIYNQNETFKLSDCIIVKYNFMVYINQLIKACFIALFIALFACTNQNPQEEIPPFSYLALGDSYTIGQGVEDSVSWPQQLNDRLLENGFQVDSTKIIAQTGWTTRKLMDGIDDTDLSQLGNEVLVSLLIGVNNQFQSLDFQDFQADFNTLLDRAIIFANGDDRVFVVSIPDYGVTPFGSSNSESIAEELDMYNAFMEGVCAEREIPFINITEISRTLGDGENALSYDKLHPSGFQYGMWVDEMYPVVEELLLNSQ